MVSIVREVRDVAGSREQCIARVSDDDLVFFETHI